MKSLMLGTVASDKITGFKGVIVGRAEYLTGCTQYCIQPECKENTFIENRWFDEGRLIDTIGKQFTKQDVAAEEKGCDIIPPKI